MDYVMTRRGALRAGAAGLLGTYLAACGGSDSTSGSSSGGQLNFLAWEDHFSRAGLNDFRAKTGAVVKVSFIKDNETTFQKMKTGADFDVFSADALWVPKFFEEKLITPMDPAELSNWSGLYEAARQVDFWQSGTDTLCVPNGWSPHVIYYDPAKVKTAPDSYAALTDPQYKGMVVFLNQASDVVAKGGVAIGAKEPYAMTDDELGKTKQYLQALKPNVLKFVDPGTAEVAAFQQGGILCTNVGFDLKVKEAKLVIPSDGTTAFADGQMLSTKSSDQDLARQFLDANAAPERFVERFLNIPHPYFSEKAFKLLVDQGKGDLAERVLYNKPDLVFEDNVALVAPPPDPQAYTRVYNEVFGA